MNVENRKLYRSRTDRMISGVAGGLADYLNIDSTIVRLLFVFFALAGGPGLLVYIVMLLVIPEEPLDAPSTVVEVDEVEE
ncbi:PspC domain-containing protein [bacterium]|nr:PspC domain-containing protein [bacterium]MCB2179287.1 PspC domain-containing protein [bacterium]